MFDDLKYLNLRKEKETVAKQLSILQNYRYMYSTSFTVVKGYGREFFFENTAQQSFPLSVARWRYFS